MAAARRASRGNALGIGLADVATERPLVAIDDRATYENILTSTFLERAKVPVIRPEDRAAVEAAVRCNCRVDADQTRLVRILNPVHLDVVQISTSLVDEVLSRGDAEVDADPFPLPFAPSEADAVRAPLRGPW